MVNEILFYFSKLKHQIDLKMYGNKQYTRVLNDYGDNIKRFIEETRHELDALKASLADYKGEEDSNWKYKNVVKEYSKAKTELAHCRHMLSMFSTSTDDSPIRGRNKI